MNIHSTLRTAPDLCQNVSLAVLFGSNGNSYTFSMQSDVCKYRYWSGKRIIKKNGRLVNAAWQEKFSPAKVRQLRFIPSYERINCVCVCECVVCVCVVCVCGGVCVCVCVCTP